MDLIIIMTSERQQVMTLQTGEKRSPRELTSTFVPSRNTARK